MSTELETKLNRILSEKTNKIIPENIKKDVQIFNITGTYEGEINNQDINITQNGTYTADSNYTGLGEVTVNVQGGSGGVKKFATVEAMNNSTGNQEGDLAIVYGSSISNWTESTQSSTLIFPSEVVLPEEYSDSIYSSFSAVDSSQMFYGDLQLNSSQFRFMVYTGSGSMNITYTSSDGITYTRTDSGEETIDIGFDIYCEYEWDDTIGYFMKTGGMSFDGLYEYKNKPGDIITLGLKLDDKLNGTSTYKYGLKSDLQTKTAADSSIGYPIFVKYEYVNDYKGYPIYTITKAYNAKSYYSNNSGLCIAYKDNKYYIAFYTTEGNTFQVYKYENGVNTLTTLNKNATTGLSSGDITLIEEINPAEWCIGSTAHYHNISYGSYSIFNFTSSSNTRLDISATNIPNYLHYVYAQTQLNLNNANQLLTGVKGYGKNGVVTGDGSIYDNLDKNMINNNIFNLDYIEANGGDRFYAGLPTKYCCDNKEAGKIKFYKAISTTEPTTHYVGSVDITQSYVYTPKSAYSFQQQLKNEKHKLVISIQYPSSGNWICQIEDAVTHDILHEYSFPVTDYIKAGVGEDYVYLFYASSSTAYVERISLTTFTKTTIDTSSFSVANQKSVIVRMNGPYIAYMFHGRNSTTSKCTVKLIDETTGNVLTLRNNETLSTSSSSHEYSLSLINNPSQVYVGSVMGTLGTRSYKLHKITKSDNTVTLLGTGSVNRGYTSDFSDSNVYEDDTYIYTKNLAVSKNESSVSSVNYISTNTNLVDINGNPITEFGTALYPQGIRYVDNKMYAMFRTFACELDSFVKSINNGYMSFTYTCKKFFPFVNEGLIYSLIPNTNMPTGAQLVYSQLDMGTFTISNNTYNFKFNNTHTNTNELEGSITFTPCIISDSLDYTYGCIYNQYNGNAGNIKNDNFIFTSFNADNPLINYEDTSTT